MKTLKNFLALAAVFLLVISFGCSKDPASADSDANSTLTTTQQTTYAAYTESNSQMAIGFAKGFSGGLAGWTPSTSEPGKSETKVPPQDWTGPVAHSNHWDTTNADGWYYYNYIYDTDTLGGKDTMVYWARFQDDLWANSSAIVIRVDWELNKAESGTEYSAYVTQQPGDSVHSGGWYVGVNISSVGLSWKILWTNVTETGWTGNPRTCSGSFTYTGYFGMKGSFIFTNGTGSGTAKYNDELFAKFTYNNDGTGYYTLVGDNYTQKYPFTW